nr:hypothetical protein [Desulfobulbaceae bacterium]
MGQLQRLDGLIEDCKARLQEQLSCLATGKMSELQQWQEACYEMQALLQESFVLVDEQGASRDEVDRIKSSLADLVRLNKQLFGAAATQRQIVSERLSRMRKGRSALGGYSCRPQTGKPRFVSSNG